MAKQQYTTSIGGRINRVAEGILLTAIMLTLMTAIYVVITLVNIS